MASEKLFKTFSDDLIKRLEIKSKRTYYYFLDDERRTLQEKKIEELTSSQVFKLEDPTRKWSDLKNERPLFFDFEISLSNIFLIFHGTEQSCFSNTRLGLALEWKPKNSKVKRCIKLGEIDDYMPSDDVTFKVDKIEIKYPNNDIEFGWFIYIIKPGAGTENNNDRYGNTEGLILASGSLWSILNGGNGSMFPIEEIAKKDAPLWSIRCNYVDWCTDEFNQDNLSIILNQAHPLYPSIMYESETYNEVVFKEVLSSAFSALINQVMLIAKENNFMDDLAKDGVEEAGSILAAIKYFKNSLGIEVDKMPADLFNSVKRLIDQERGLK